MKLHYDPADPNFWEQVSQISGCPQEASQKPLPIMWFESNALYRLPEALVASGVSKKQVVLAVMDSTPMQRGSESLKPLVMKTLQKAGYQISPLVLVGDATGQVHTDMRRIEAVKDRLQPGTAVISIGSGTVTDIAKHACYLYQKADGEHVPFISFQTANSVSAFTSNMAPVFLRGIKRTLESCYPDALVCDLETLCDAPAAMTVAGVGDLLPIYTGYPDWYLAGRLGMEASFNEFVAELLGPIDDILLFYAQDIRNASPQGMSILAKLISLIGLALSLFHSTAPLSGYEHIFSHTLDLLNSRLGLPLVLHGSQVAAAIVFLAPIYCSFIEDFEPAEVDIEQCYPSMESMQVHIPQIFQAIDPSGQIGEACWLDYGIKLEKWNAARDSLAAFLENWDEIREELSLLTRPAEHLVEVLHATGTPTWFDQLSPIAMPEQVKFAFLNSPLTRQRLSLGDLLIFFGWDRESLWQHAWEIGSRLAKG
jgi:glycerol-1-phosphate dehydrogenase [NAD(P)+]